MHQRNYLQCVLIFDSFTIAITAGPEKSLTGTGAVKVVSVSFLICEFLALNSVMNLSEMVKFPEEIHISHTLG